MDKRHRRGLVKLRPGTHGAMGGLLLRAILTKSGAVSSRQTKLPALKAFARTLDLVNMQPGELILPLAVNSPAVTEDQEGN